MNRLTVIKRTALPVLLGLMLGACTTSPKVQVNQSRDKSLSCAGLEDELGALDATEAQIRANDSAGKKAVGAILWLPGYVYSKNDQARAMRLLGERRARLLALKAQRGC